MAKELPQLKDGEQLVYFQAGGEWCFLRTPKGYKASRRAGGAVPFIIRNRGQNGYVREGAADWDRSDTSRVLIDMFIDQGFAVAGSNLGGDHWGRPSALAANWALFNRLVEGANVDPDRVGMINGGGMGATATWNSVLGPFAGRVGAAVLLQGVVSFESMIRNPKHKRLPLDAYGLPLDTSDDVAVTSLAYNDPLTQTRLLLGTKGKAFARTLPKTLLLHGDRDPDVLYEKNAEALYNLLKVTDANITLKTYKGMGHNLSTQGEPFFQTICDFFREALAR